MPQTEDNPTKPARSFNDVWDDPKFRSATPDVQKRVLTKLGVSGDRVDKLMLKLGQGTGTGQGTAKTPPSTAAPAPAVHSFLSRVSGRVASSLHGINQAITKSIAATEPGTEEHKETVASIDRTFSPGFKPNYRAAIHAYPPVAAFDMAKEWIKDPANLAGDAITAYILGKATPSPEPASVPEPRLVPRVSTATPAAEATASATGYPNGLSAEQWTGYVDKVNKAYHDHLQDLGEYAGKEARARAKWAQKAYGATQSVADQVEAVNKRNVLSRAGEEYTDLAQKNIRDVHQTVRARLDSRWNQFREAMSGAETDSVQVGKVIQDAQSRLKGSPADLKQFNDLIRESGVEVSDEGEITIQEGKGPTLPIDTLRVHSSAIGDKLAAGNLPGNVYQALKSAKTGLENIIEDSADQLGQGDIYRDLKQDWSQYMSDWNDMRAVATGKGSVLARALRTPDPAYLHQLIKGNGGDLLLETLGKYKDAGAKPALVSNARNLIKRAVEIKVPKANVPNPIGLKNRLEAAGVSKYEPGQPPKLKEVPLPQPEPVSVEEGKAPRWAQATGRITGKLLGAKALGFKGYVAGGEAGNYLVDRLWRGRNNVTVSPVQSTTLVPEVVPPPNAPAVPPGMRFGDWERVQK